jgi:hypothetical protein
VAWVFEWPGCYGRGATREAAIDQVPQAIEELQLRLHQSAFVTEVPAPPIEIVVAEEFRGYPFSSDYIVNAFFENDRLPLTGRDVEYSRHLLGLNRQYLEMTASGLAASVLGKTIPGEVQNNIRGILRHVGTAEWWYWDRLGLAFPRGQRPDDVFTLLSEVREFTLARLPELIGGKQTTVRSGETWSARKLVRRAIWHERVHTLQIQRYLKSGVFI